MSDPCALQGTWKLSLSNTTTIRCLQKSLLKDGKRQSPEKRYLLVAQPSPGVASEGTKIEKWQINISPPFSHAGRRSPRDWWRLFHCPAFHVAAGMCVMCPTAWAAQGQAALKNTGSICKKLSFLTGNFRPQSYQQKNKKKIRNKQERWTETEASLGHLYIHFPHTVPNIILGVNLCKPNFEREAERSPRISASQLSTITIKQDKGLSFPDAAQSEANCTPFITVRNASVPIAHKQTQTLILLVT